MTDIKNLYILQKTESHVMMKPQPTVMFMILKESIILTVISKDLKNLFLRVLTLQDTFIGRLWTTLNGRTAIPNVLD